MQILVEVACPMVSATYDYRVDNHITVENFVKKLIQDIANLCADTNILQYSSEVILFSEDGALPRQKTLCEMRIRSGSRLLLL